MWTQWRRAQAGLGSAAWCLIRSRQMSAARAQPAAPMLMALLVWLPLWMPLQNPDARRGCRTIAGDAMPERNKYQPPTALGFDPAKYQHLLTQEPPAPTRTGAPARNPRSPIFKAGEWMSQVGNGVDLMSTLDFLYKGDTEHNPIFGARPNPAALSAVKGGQDAFNRWIMQQMVDAGLPEWAAGAYGMFSGFLPLRAGINNMR